MARDRLLQFFLFAIGIGGLHGAFVRQSRGSCPPFTSKPDFDYRQYAGVWYEIQRMPTTVQDGMICVRATYEEIGPNEISVLNTAVFADSGELTSINGTAYQPDPENQPGYLVVSFSDRPSGFLYILDTDYTTYTSVYDCVNVGAFKLEYAWLMSRSNTMTSEALATAQEVFIRNGIDINLLQETPHPETCVYYP